MERLRQLLREGTLRHPGLGAPTTTELARGMAALCGAPLRPTAGERALMDLIGEYDHYLFVLVDGLGMNLMDRFPSGGLLATAPTTPMHSVFPSTTAVALTTLATGNCPAEHGFTGWWTFFPEHVRVIAPLLFRERATLAPAEAYGLALPDIQPCPPILPEFTRETMSFLPVEIADGSYAKWSRGGTPQATFSTHAEVLHKIRRYFHQQSAPSYAYLYLLTVDKLSHSHGMSSDEVTAEIARVDQLLTRLRDRLPESVRMIVTADHGLVDVPKELQFVIQEGDEIDQYLVAGTTAEARSPVAHVRPGAEREFFDAFSRHPASAEFEFVPTDDFLALGLTGRASLSPSARGHWGDFVGYSSRPAILRYDPKGVDPHIHVGEHGGLLPGEIEVPLTLA